MEALEEVMMVSENLKGSEKGMANAERLGRFRGGKRVSYSSLYLGNRYWSVFIRVVYYVLVSETTIVQKIVM